MIDKNTVVEFEPVIGLEVHAQLSTESKIFCACRVEYGVPPNSRTCPVCLGLPGALPVLNKKAVEYAVMMILAVGGEVNLHSEFARKNYFYPDLPKGYQITQYERPIGTGGSVRIKADDGGEKAIAINRIHLEEDAGKLIHGAGDDKHSKVDLNRCGVPLIEIVSEPDMTTPREAYDYLKKLKQILQYLGICTGDMEKGHFRCDANISIRKKGEKIGGIRTELKNLNSFRFVEKALNYEIERQTGLIKAGRPVEQATLMWNGRKQVAEQMRTKEEADDYRYFPEPDLPPCRVDRQTAADIILKLPELPDEKLERFVKEYKLSKYDAAILTETRPLADCFETVMGNYDNSKAAANWMINDVLRVLHEVKLEVEDFTVPPKDVADLLKLIDSGEISVKIAREVFSYMVDSGGAPADIVAQKGWLQITDSGELEKIVESVLAEEGENIQRYRDGQKELLGYFVGQVMKKTGGLAAPESTNKIIREKLDGLEG